MSIRSNFPLERLTGGVVQLRMICEPLWVAVTCVALTRPGRSGGNGGPGAPHAESQNAINSTKIRSKDFKKRVRFIGINETIHEAHEETLRTKTKFQS